MKHYTSFFQRVDEKIDKIIIPFWHSIRYYIPFFTITLLSILVAVFVIRIVRNKPDFTAAIITHDIKKIERILHQIDDACDILSFNHAKNNIDFLTVESFVGSEVGGLSLARPENWQGPYLRDNPTLQNKLYQLVKTDEGLFVLPGDGVELPNGLVLARDIVIKPETSVLTLMQEKASLHYRGEALGAKLMFRIGDWKGAAFNTDKANQMSKMLEQFNKTLPYAQNKKRSIFGQYNVKLPKFYQ